MILLPSPCKPNLWRTNALRRGLCLHWVGGVCRARGKNHSEKPAKQKSNSKYEGQQRTQIITHGSFVSKLQTLNQKGQFVDVFEPMVLSVCNCKCMWYIYWYMHLCIPPFQPSPSPSSRVGIPALLLSKALLPSNSRYFSTFGYFRGLDKRKMIISWFWQTSNQIADTFSTCGLHPGSRQMKDDCKLVLANFKSNSRYFFYLWFTSGVSTNERWL